MATIKVRFWLEAIEAENGLEIIVKKIKKEDDEIWFQFDEKVQDKKHHVELFKLNTIKNNIKGLNHVGQKRRVLIEASKKLAAIYMDNDSGIFKFKSQILAEDEEEDKIKIENPLINQKDLLQLLTALTKRLDNEDYINKKLNLNKYDGKSDAKLFIIQFEKEINKLNLNDDTKIQVFGRYLTNSANKWYASSTKKFENETWNVWKQSFLAVFGVKNWSNITNAFQYKYMGGSLIEYAITKEKLLRDTNENMHDTTIINQIIINTPTYVQGQIKPGSINNLNKLFEELAKINLKENREYHFERSTQSGTSTKLTRMKNNNNSKQTLRKPCSICENFGFKERYHPEDICRNKNKVKNTIKANLVKEINRRGNKFRR